MPIPEDAHTHAHPLLWPHQTNNRLLAEGALGFTPKTSLLEDQEVYGAQSLARKVLITDLAAEAILCSLDGVGATDKQQPLECTDVSYGGVRSFIDAINREEGSSKHISVTFKPLAPKRLRQ